MLSYEIYFPEKVKFCIFTIFIFPNLLDKFFKYLDIDWYIVFLNVKSLKVK